MKAGQQVTTLITAAGDSRQLFLSSGFPTPKSLVSPEGQAVLSHAINSYAYDLTRTTVAINREEESEWSISTRILEQFPTVRILPVSSKVRGAMATALIALDVSRDSPLIIAAGDSKVVGGISHHIDQFIEDDVDAATIAFRASEPRWSYLQINEAGGIERVAEKEVIGPLATTGVFFFRSLDDFMRSASWALVNNASNNGIFFVSTTLNYLIAQGKRVAYSEIAREEYKSWSLPVDFTT